MHLGLNPRRIDSTKEICKRLGSRLELIPEITDLPDILELPLPTDKVGERQSLPPLSQLFHSNSHLASRILDDLVRQAIHNQYDPNDPQMLLNDLIVEPLQILSKYNAPFFVECRRNPNTRETPNLLCWYGSTLIFKGEESPHAEDYEFLIHSLTSHMHTWSPIFYGDLEYMLCYVCAGNLFQFFVVEKNLRAKPLTKPIDLRSPHNRLILLQAVINLFRIFHTLAPMLDHNMAHWPLHKEMIHSSGTSLTFFEKFVTKRVPDFHLREFSHFEALKQLYSTIHQFNIPNIAHPYRPPTLENDLFQVDLSPVGYSQLPETEDDLKNALRCLLRALHFIHQYGFVHRDICWANIVKTPSDSGEWVLIDLELANFADLQPENKLDTWPREVETIGFTSAADIFMVGDLLDPDFFDFTLGEEIEEFQMKLQNPNVKQRPTAFQALNDPYLRC